MSEQEAIEFLFEILQRILIYHEELTDEQREILGWYEYYLNGFYKRDDNG